MKSYQFNHLKTALNRIIDLIYSVDNVSNVGACSWADESQWLFSIKQECRFL